MSVRGIFPTAQSVFLPGTYTVDTLPDPAANIDMYARVTDLFGGKRDLVLASQDQSGAFWQPVRPVYKGAMTLTTDTELIPLKHPSVLSITGSIPLGVVRSINLSRNLVFPGAQFTIRTRLTTLLGSLKLLDGVTTLLSGLLINNSYTYYYDPNNGWEQI